ncbi:MAG TPA: cytochrome c biogenesis CcdA family protein [Acidimicrobiales bacterium]
MIAGIGPDGPLAVYLAAGMVATVNPCGFAMLPAYLSYFLGLEGAGERAPRPRLGQAFRVSFVVSTGFLAVFALAGAAAELTTVPVYENAPWISIVIGIALFALGVAMLCGFQPAARLPKLERGGRKRTVGSMFVFGVSYAIASIGCTLPLFLSAVAGTMSRDSLTAGLVVFGIYAAGMTLVLTALTVAIALARTSLVRRLRDAQAHVGRISGGLVALAGAYVVHYGWLSLRTYGSRAGAIPKSGVIDTVTSWSYTLSDWIADAGAVRIALVLATALAALAAGAWIRDRRSTSPALQPDATEPRPSAAHR